MDNACEIHVGIEKNGKIHKGTLSISSNGLFFSGDNINETIYVDNWEAIEIIPGIKRKKILGIFSRNQLYVHISYNECDTNTYYVSDEDFVQIQTVIGDLIREYKEKKAAVEKRHQEELARQEAERKRQEELARQEAERKHQEELARQEAERKRQEELAWQEAEQRRWENVVRDAEGYDRWMERRWVQDNTNSDESMYSSDDENDEDDEWTYNDKLDDIEAFSDYSGDFESEDDYKKAVIIEDADLNIEDYKDFFENYDDVINLSEEEKDLIRAGVDYYEFLSAGEEERLNLLKQFNLNIDDFRCFFLNQEIEIATETSLTYSEYDYYRGNSYLQKESDLHDYVEGNEKIKVYQERQVEAKEDKYFYERYLFGIKKSDYEIYSELKEEYPDMKDIVASTLTQFEIPETEQKTIIQEIKNGDETRRDILASSYAATILRESFFDSEEYQVDFIELWGQYAEFLMEGINNLRTGKHAKTPLVYFDNRRKHYNILHAWLNDDVITLPLEIKETVYRYDDLSNRYGDYFYSRLLKAIKDKRSLRYPNFAIIEDHLLYWLTFEDNDSDSLRDLAEYMNRSIVSFELMMDNNENINGDVPDCLRSQSAEDIAVHLAMTSVSHAIVQQLLPYLTERQRKIIELRFGLLDDRIRTLEQVGRELHITRERVRQEQEKALRTMKRMFYYHHYIGKI